MSGLLLKNVSFMGFDSPDIKDGIDVLIDEKGFVSRMGFNISDEKSENIDLKGLILSPGWIDMHTHVYEKGIDMCVNPEEIGALAGVTVVVDAGSAGEANFDMFRDCVIKKYDNTKVISFINIGSLGLASTPFDVLGKFNPDRLYKCIQKNREYIRGVKILAGNGFGGWTSEALKLACKAAAEVDLPLMVHISDAMPLVDDILPKLKKGDIVTHCYHGRPWGILEKSKVIPEAIEARERGVLFDVGHGFGSFNVYVAEQAIAQGFKPDSISTDLHIKSIKWLCCSMALTMSKFLSLGLSLEEVIRDAATNPAEMLGIESYSNGIIGKKARFTVFTVEDREMDVMDNYGTEWTIHSMICPKYTIIDNRVIKVTANLTGEYNDQCVANSRKKDLGSPEPGYTWGLYY